MAVASDAQFDLVRHLADNDKSVRDRAVKTLQEHLVQQKDIAEIDMLKIWKGIFYCTARLNVDIFAPPTTSHHDSGTPTPHHPPGFWISDKSTVQLELADRLARVVYALSDARAAAYLTAFWNTVGREWTGIDRLRYQSPGSLFLLSFFLFVDDDFFFLFFFSFSLSRVFQSRQVHVTRSPDAASLFRLVALQALAFGTAR